MIVNDASRIIIDDSRVPLQIMASLTDNSRGIIFDRNMFKVQATEIKTMYLLIRLNCHLERKNVSNI